MLIVNYHPIINQCLVEINHCEQNSLLYSSETSTGLIIHVHASYPILAKLGSDGLSRAVIAKVNVFAELVGSASLSGGVINVRTPEVSPRVNTPNGYKIKHIFDYMNYKYCILIVVV